MAKEAKNYAKNLIKRDFLTIYYPMRKFIKRFNVFQLAFFNTQASDEKVKFKGKSFRAPFFARHSVEKEQTSKRKKRV
jgi:hypothetical protein